jgi:hypothetical protein
MMKAVYFVVRLIAGAVIVTAKAIAFLYWGIYHRLYLRIVKSKYWEQRILLSLAVVAWCPFLAIPIPFIVVSLTHSSFAWMLLVPMGCASLFPMLFACSDYVSERDGKIPLDKVMWHPEIGINKQKTKITVTDESDSNYKEGSTLFKRDSLSERADRATR